MAISSWHVGVAAEAFAAAVFARYGYDVSVQYGANQPEYDLIATSGDCMLKISVKGSQDGSWGLTQGYKKGCDYHTATAKWLKAHHKKTIFCLVQFQGTAPDEMPRIYLATPQEIADRLNASAGGRDDRGRPYDLCRPVADLRPGGRGYDPSGGCNRNRGRCL